MPPSDDTATDQARACRDEYVPRAVLQFHRYLPSFHVFTAASGVVLLCCPLSCALLQPHLPCLAKRKVSVCLHHVSSISSVLSVLSLLRPLVPHCVQEGAAM